jgi:predicted 3-demethylubiquinone-9 3-methyltransferase (glyoxalase superfamily)
MPKITPFLWFDTEAEAAARFYVGLFPDSNLLEITRYGDGAPMPKGTVMTVAFTLDGQPFTALNGGPHFKLSEAVSFVIHCKSQDEVDRYWDALSADGGQTNVCGWLKDRFGLSWQVTPDRLMELLSDPDKAKAQRVMQAMMGMTKIDIAGLERAAAG